MKITTRVLLAISTVIAVSISLILQLYTYHMPIVNTAVASGMALVTGTYLGLDLMVSVTETTRLPKGEFKKINAFKFIFSLICLLLVVVSISLLSWYYQESNDSGIAVLSGSIFLIFSYWIAGRKMTKIKKETCNEA